MSSRSRMLNGGRWRLTRLASRISASLSDEVTKTSTPRDPLDHVGDLRVEPERARIGSVGGDALVGPQRRLEVREHAPAQRLRLADVEHPVGGVAVDVDARARREARELLAEGGGVRHCPTEYRSAGKGRPRPPDHDRRSVEERQLEGRRVIRADDGEVPPVGRRDGNHATGARRPPRPRRRPCRGAGRRSARRARRCGPTRPAGRREPSGRCRPGRRVEAPRPEAPRTWPMRKAVSPTTRVGTSSAPGKPLKSASARCGTRPPRRRARRARSCRRSAVLPVAQIHQELVDPLRDVGAAAVPRARRAEFADRARRRGGRRSLRA